jgi:hypothetical protein
LRGYRFCSRSNRADSAGESSMLCGILFPNQPTTKSF